MPPLVQAVWDRALAEWRRGEMMGRREPSFVRVTLDECIAWCMFIGEPPTEEAMRSAKACGQHLAIVV